MKNIKRIFYIKGNKNVKRGGHAHKKCNQFLICQKGKVRVNCISSKKNKRTFLLKNNKTGLFINKMTWTDIEYLENDTIIIKTENTELTMATSDLTLQGKHNTKNAMAAATVAKLLKIRKNLGTLILTQIIMSERFFSVQDHMFFCQANPYIHSKGYGRLCQEVTSECLLGV